MVESTHSPSSIQAEDEVISNGEFSDLEEMQSEYEYLVNGGTEVEEEGEISDEEVSGYQKMETGDDSQAPSETSASDKRDRDSDYLSEEEYGNSEMEEEEETPIKDEK